MDFTKLFETQKILDQKIINNQGLEGKDLLPEKCLALLVEIGELTNAWRGFKFWSKNQKPQQPVMLEGVTKSNPLLEEYVDCLHFILSIGNEMGIKKLKLKELNDNNYFGHTYALINLYSSVSRLTYYTATFRDLKGRQPENEYNGIMSRFLRIGHAFGFTDDEIESAYYDKNKINHSRQENGY